MRRLLAALAVFFCIGSASPLMAQNYAATAGSGLTFGSKLVSSVQYPQFLACDPTTPSQCVAVNASGQLTIVGTGTLAVQAAVTAASGAYASGSLASGAVVDITNLSGPLAAGAATATKAMQVGGQFLTTQPTMTNTQQAGLLYSTRGELLVAPGVSGFNVLNAGTFAVQASQSGSWNVGGAAGASVTMQNAAVANGNGTSLTVTNFETVLLNVNCSVACSGGTTINFEGTDSTGTFFSIIGIPVAGNSSGVQTTATSGQFYLPVSGLTTVRARISAYSAGTITVTGTPVYGTNASLSQNVTQPATIGNGSSGIAPFSTNAPVVSFNYGYNGTSWDQLQVDGSKSLKVNCVTGCTGSGGTSSSFNATFPATGTAVGAEYLSSAPTLTSGQMVAFQVTSAGSLHTTVDNTNANGSATSANSSPVVIASDQAAVAVKTASGAIASGSIASGAFASGAVSSGAYASGSLASGAVVDITNLSTPITPAAATATKGVLLGMQFNSTQATFTNGQQGSVQGTSRGAVYVAVGADGFSISNTTFAVTNSGTFAVQLNSTPSLANGNGVVPTQGGAVLSATNGIFTNLLQGNAVLSATNPIWVAAAQAASTTMQNAAVANGNGTSLTVTGYETALVNVNCSVACSGGTTINFEGTDSTGTFFSLAASPVAGGPPVTTATTSGQFWIPVAALTTIRARISGYSAGTITVTGTPVAGNNIATVSVAQATAANLNATVVGTGTFAVQAAQSGTWNITNISGTVSLPTGASTSANQPTNAAIASTTSGQTGTLTMGAVTTSAPSYTTAQTDPLSLDTSGNLRVNVTTGTVAVTQASASVASGAYSSGAFSSGAMVDITNLSTPITPATATATKGVLLGMQFNSTQATFTNGQQGAVQGTSRGALYVAVGADGFNVTNSGTFAVQAAQSGTWNITNISGTVSLPTGAATSANQPTNAAQASTTSGQTGTLMLGAVTTAAPTYTTAQSDPFSLDTSGNLRVNCTTGCSSSGGSSLADEGTFTQGTTSFTVQGGFYNTAVTNLTSGQAGASAITADRLIKEVAGLTTSTLTAWNSGTSLNATQNLMVNGNTGAQAILVQLDQTTTITGGAVTFQGTYDGANWVTIPTSQVLNPNTFAALTNPYTFVASTNQPFLILTQGYQQVRINLTTVITGTGAVTPNVTLIPYPIGDGVGAVGSAPPANASQIGSTQSGATGGLLKGVIQCDNHVFKHITTATDTLAVQGVASQTIYVCGWRSRAAGVATWFLENTASTNANCSSTNTQLIGVATEATNTGETVLAPFWTGLKNTSGNGLCINSTGTGGVDVDVWFTQF